MDDLRAYAMKLHTREQAPKEGQAPAPRKQQAVSPTRRAPSSQFPDRGGWSDGIV